MAEETNTASAATQGAIGHIVRIVGPVVDVEFAPDHMPAIYNALTVKATTPVGDINVVLEVQMHLPGDLVRSVAMSSTDGLVRGLPVQDTGAPMKMPVGPETLGRIWNVMGQPVDGMPMPDVKQSSSTRPRSSKPVLRLSTLFSLSLRVVRPVCSAVQALVRPLSSRSSSITWPRSMVVRLYSPALASVPVRVPTCSWK